MLALLVAAAVPVAAGAAGPRDGDVPAEVAAWFEDSGPGIVAMLAARSAGSDNPFDFSKRSVIGEPVRVFDYDNDQALARGSFEEGVAALERWSAPILVSGEAVGTLTVERASDGTLQELVSDDAAKGQALAEFSPEATYIDDPVNGAFIVEGDHVTQVNSETGPEGATASVEDLQAALEDQKETVEAAQDAAGGDPVLGVAPIRLQDYAGKGAARRAAGGAPSAYASDNAGIIAWGGTAGVLVVGFLCLRAVARMRGRKPSPLD
jgi:hypothetical protein